MPIDVDKKSLVVQSNSLIEAKYKLSVEEQKVIKILVSQIQKDDKDFQDYEFRIKTLAELLGMEHKDPYRVLRDITKKLISRVLEFYNTETKRFVQTSWLSSAEYVEGEGTVILHFDPLLKPLLLQLQSYFTKYELGQVLQFKGQYTIRFFEFRKSFLGRNKKEVSFALKTLREIFGLKENEYRDFDNFRRRVLEPARIELLEKTGKSFSLETVRKGRGGKITGVRFVFDGENESQNDDRDKKVVLASQKKSKDTAEDSGAINLLVNCGVSRDIAEEFANNYEKNYIKEKIAIAEVHPEYVKNKAGFIIEAIKGNWLNDDIIRIRQEGERRKVEQEKERRRKRLNSIVDAYNAFRKTFGFEQYKKLSEDEKRRLRGEFLAKLDTFFYPRYAGKDSFGFEDHYFRSFIMEQLTIPTFDWYVVDKGIALDKEDYQLLKSENPQS